MRGVAARAAAACFVAACILAAAQADSCMPDGFDPKVTIGEKAYLCLRFNNQTQAVFTPEVDKYTQISISGSNTAVPENTGYFDMTDRRFVMQRTDNTHEYVIAVNPVVHDVAAGFWKTYKKWRAGTDNVVTQSVITAIILVDEGVITGITYDNGCYFCDPDDGAACVLDTFIPDTVSILDNSDYKGCVSEPTDCTGATECDLNMYVVWSGTDSNGDYMRSAGMRFSRFRAFGVEGLYNAAKKTALEEAQTASSAAGKVQTLAGGV